MRFFFKKNPHRHTYADRLFFVFPVSLFLSFFCSNVCVDVFVERAYQHIVPAKREEKKAWMQEAKLAALKACPLCKVYSPTTRDDHCCSECVLEYETYCATMGCWQLCLTGQCRSCYMLYDVLSRNCSGCRGSGMAEVCTNGGHSHCLKCLDLAQWMVAGKLIDSSQTPRAIVLQDTPKPQQQPTDTHVV